MIKEFKALYEVAISGYPPAVKAAVENGTTKSFAYYIYCKFEMFVDKIIPFVARNFNEVITIDWHDSQQNLVFIQRALDESSPVPLRASVILDPQPGVMYLAAVEFSTETLAEEYDLPNGEGSVIVTYEDPSTQVGIYTVENGFMFLGQKFANTPVSAVSKYSLFNVERI